MKARDAFGVVVRAVGFGCIVAAIFDLGYLVLDLLGLPVPPGHPPVRLLIAAGLYLIIGLALLAGASSIVSVVYGRDKPD